MDPVTAYKAYQVARAVPWKKAAAAGVAVLVALVLVVVAVAATVADAARQARTANARACSPTGPPPVLPVAAGPAIAGLDPTQTGHATTIVRVGQTRSIPALGIVVALATASQESRFRNYANDGLGGDLAPDQAGVAASLTYPHDAVGTDHGSVGIMQQQYPWWGTLTELMDPATSAGKFYDSLLAVPAWDTLPVTVAAQRVQRSAYPTAYADDEPLAWELLTAITGDPTLIGGSPTAPCAAVPVAAGDYPGGEPGPWGGFPNGRIPPEHLVALSVDPAERLRADAAAAFEAMNTAYTAAFGTPMSVTDAYRDYAGQVAVYAARPDLAAKPGTSNHGWALALDLGGGIQSGGAQYQWMRANAPRFGWDNPPWARPGGSRVELWHWEYHGPPTTGGT